MHTEKDRETDKGYACTLKKLHRNLYTETAKWK